MIFKINSSSLTRTGMATLALTCCGIQAQNLVPNASFEQVAEDTREKDIKTFGLVNACLLYTSDAADD